MILRRAARTRGTGNRLGIVTAAFAILFAVAYVVVPHIRSRDEPLVATSTAKSVQQRPPLVAVIKVEIVPSDQTLTLPGDVRGWHTSTINARVSGYVAKWIVDIGDRVTKGQRLGLSGATGRVTGPHLHLSARWQGEYVDPAVLLRLPLPAIY